MKIRSMGLFVCLLLFLVQGIFANTVTGPQHITASDGQQGDGFGTAIAIGGNYVAVGAPGDDGGAGAVYIFRYDGTNWTEIQRIVATDREPQQLFGAAVSMNGNRLAVGASYAKKGDANAGAVYIFERNGNTWTQVFKIVSEDGAPDDFFGSAVSLDGDMVAVGAYADDVPITSGSIQNGGSVYIFEPQGGLWVQRQRISVPSPISGAWFGFSLDLESNRLLVGGPFQTITGSAYVYERTGPTFVMTKHLEAPPADNLQPFSQFGRYVSLSGGTAAIGVIGDDSSGNDAGSAYVFVQNTGGDWVPQVRLKAPTPVLGGSFGGSLSVHGDLLLIGGTGHDNSRGASWLYRRVAGTWQLVDKIQPLNSNLDDFIGLPVVVTDDFALLGARFNDIRGPASGSAWIYKIFAPPVGVFKDIFGSMRAGVYQSAALATAGGVFESNMGAGASNNGRVVVAARDASGGVWANEYNALNNSFGNTQFAGGVVQGDVSVAYPGNGTALVAVRDTFSAVWIQTFTPGTGFGAWRNLGGVFDTDPVAAACSDGSVYMVGRDKFNGLWSGRYLPATNTWGGWHFFGGIVKGRPSIACGTDNAIYIGVRDTFDGVHIARVKGTQLSGWFSGQGIVAVDPLVAASGGRIFVTVLDAFGGLFYRVFEEGPGNGWQNWNSVGGSFEAIAPAAVNHELYVVGRSPAPKQELYWWRETGNSFTFIANGGQTVNLINSGPR